MLNPRGTGRPPTDTIFLLLPDYIRSMINEVAQLHSVLDDQTSGTHNERLMQQYLQVDRKREELMLLYLESRAAFLIGILEDTGHRPYSQGSLNNWDKFINDLSTSGSVDHWYALVKARFKCLMPTRMRYKIRDTAVDILMRHAERWSQVRTREYAVVMKAMEEFGTSNEKQEGEELRTWERIVEDMGGLGGDVFRAWASRNKEW